MLELRLGLLNGKQQYLCYTFTKIGKLIKHQ